MSFALPALALLGVFAAGYWFGRQAEHSASVAELARMAGERDRAVRLVQECQAHLAEVQAIAPARDVGVIVWDHGPSVEA